MLSQFFSKSTQFLYKFIPVFSEPIKNIVNQRISKITEKFNEKKIYNKNKEDYYMEMYFKNKKKYGQAISALKTLALRTETLNLLLMNVNHYLKHI